MPRCVPLNAASMHACAAAIHANLLMEHVLISNLLLLLLLGLPRGAGRECGDSWSGCGASTGHLRDMWKGTGSTVNGFHEAWGLTALGGTVLASLGKGSHHLKEEESSGSTFHSLVTEVYEEFLKLCSSNFSSLGCALFGEIMPALFNEANNSQACTLLPSHCHHTPQHHTHLASVAHEFGDSCRTSAPALLWLPDDVRGRIVEGSFHLGTPHLQKEPTMPLIVDNKKQIEHSHCS